MPRSTSLRSRLAVAGRTAGRLLRRIARNLMEVACCGGPGGSYECNESEPEVSDDHHQYLSKNGTIKRRRRPRLLPQAPRGAPYHHVKPVAKASEIYTDHWPQALSHRDGEQSSSTSASGKLLLLLDRSILPIV